MNSGKGRIAALTRSFALILVLELSFLLDADAPGRSGGGQFDNG